MGMKLGTLCGAVGLLLVFSSPALAQVMDTGVVSPKEQEARDAGIGTYRILQDGALSSVTVWGIQGEDLANCQIQWLEHGTEATCTLAAGGEYRLAWHGQLEEGSFEDLATGERATFRFVWDDPPPEGLIQLSPGEEFPVPEGHWVVEGDKTREEVEAAWSEVSTLIGQIVGEVMQTLGNVSLEGTPMTEAGPASYYGGCGPYEQEVCTGTGGVIGSGISLGETRCCRAASEDADAQCQIVSGRFCCANRSCTAHCIGIFCRCDVGGLVWACIPCD